MKEGEEKLVDHLVKTDRHVRVVGASYPKARKAVLRRRAIVFSEGLTLVEVELETGRPHQIRVQLAHRGTPILGDLRYGARRELDGRNLALHSYFLRIQHPTQREDMAWVAPPPDTWGERFRHEIETLIAARDQASTR